MMNMAAILMVGSATGLDGPRGAALVVGLSLIMLGLVLLTLALRRRSQ